MAALGELAGAVAAARAAIQTALGDPAGATRLFDIVSDAIPADQAARTGITIYDTANRPVAWAGRVIDLAKQRVSGPAALFVAPGALGPRLVRVEPVGNANRSATLRDATIVVEQSLAGLQPATGLAPDTAVVSTSLVPVTIRTEFDSPGTPGDRRLPSGNYAFVIPSRTGGLLVEAGVSRTDLTEARCAGGTVLGGVRRGPRAHAHLVRGSAARPAAAGSNHAVFRAATISVAVIVIAARSALLWVAASVAGPQLFGSPADVLLTRWPRRLLSRCRRPAGRGAWRNRAGPLSKRSERTRRLPGRGGLFVAGALAACALAAYEQFLQQIVAGAGPRRSALLAAPATCRESGAGVRPRPLHAAVVWERRAGLRRRRLLAAAPALGSSRHGDDRLACGAAAVVGVITARTSSMPLVPWCVSLAACGACAAAFAGLSRRSRRAGSIPACRTFVALVVPAIALYPSLFFHATAAKNA